MKRFAQRIYDGLTPDEQTIARNIFVRITSLGDGVSDTRRRVPRGDLYPIDVETETVDRVIDKLSGKDARLIVASDEGVEVTHESLLQEWDTLRGWLESNRDAKRLLQQITEAAQLWQKEGCSDDDLYKGARLELAEQWEQTHPKTLTELEQAFLDASKVLASGSDDSTVRLWDAATGEPLRTLEDHTGSVWSLAFSPDGNVLASGSGDRTVRLWDLRPMRLLLNPGAPSPRSALISGALQRLWGLRVNGLDIEPESWDGFWPRDGYHVDQEITLGEEYGPEYAGRTFNIRPLLDPPPPGEDKLDQLLRWLKDQGM